ncbi:MAG TPA: hypothetical protein VFF17_13560 [Thermoanaerobaculia bacterium]|nr:hypothetical protein [Thermoanaerobaculia bacterium]
MSRRGRAILSGLAVAVLFSLPLVPEIVGSRRLVFRDAHVTHWPWRRVAMDLVSSGKAPFVNETASGGQPLLANPNAVLLYPSLLLEKLVPPASAFNLHYLLHVLWAYFGARALASRLGVSDGGAFFSGVAYAFSGAMLSYASAFANAGPAAAWLPWCAAAVLDLARADTWRMRIRASAATGLAFGLQFLAGEPAISLLTGVFAAALAAAAWLASRRDRLASGGRLAAGGALAAAVGLGVAAPLLLPLLEIVRLTFRGQHLYSARAFGASPFAPWQMVEWLFPRFAGDPGSLGEGAHWQYRLHEGDLVYLWSVTFGVLPLLVVLAAGIRRAFWSRRAIFLAAGAVVTLAFSFGFALPFYRLLYSAEFLRRLRYPIKFYLLTTLCVALLSGFAVDALRRRRGGYREAVLFGLVVVFFAFAFFASGENGLLDRLVRPHLSGPAAQTTDLLPTIRRVFRGDAVFGVVAALLAAALVFPRRTRGTGHALGLATLVLALPAGLPLFVSSDHEDLERPPALLPALRSSGRLYVSPPVPGLSAAETEYAPTPSRLSMSKLARVQIEEMIPATAAPFGVRYMFDEDPDGSYGWVNRAAGDVLTASKPDERAQLLTSFGTRFILAERGSAFAGFRPVTGFAVAGRHLVLHETPAAAPDLRWASRAFRRTSLSGSIELVRSDLFRPVHDVVLPGPKDEGPGPVPSPAYLLERVLEADRALVDVDAGAPGHMIFSRTFFPAWKGRLDGSPVPVLLANGRDLAVAVPPGKHRVEIFWNPASFRRGVVLQGLALLAAFGTLLGGFVRSRAWLR